MSFLFAHRRGYGVVPAAGAALSRRPQAANPPLRFSRKLSARQGRTRLRQFAHPGQPVLKKLPPRSGEHACGSSSAPLDFTLISYYTEKAKYVVPTTKQEEI